MKTGGQEGNNCSEKGVFELSKYGRELSFFGERGRGGLEDLRKEHKAKNTTNSEDKANNFLLC
jgi:hypothetical protein